MITHLSPPDYFKEHQALIKRISANLNLEIEAQSDDLFNVISTTTPVRIMLLVHPGVLKIAKALWQTLFHSTHIQKDGKEVLCLCKGV